VSVTFHAAHPKNNLRTQGTFLEIQQWLPYRDDADQHDDSKSGQWITYADDGDTNTFFHWKRSGFFASQVTIEWAIPKDTPLGKYRIKVNGDYKKIFTKTIMNYSGLSSEFHVYAYDK
jgi:neutral ceramidase